MGPDPLYIAKVAETVRLSVRETDDPREFRQYLLELHDVLYDADLDGELYEELLTSMAEHTERLQKDHPLGEVDEGRRTRILDDVYRVEQFCQRKFSGSEREAAPGTDDAQVGDAEAGKGALSSSWADSDHTEPEEWNEAGHRTEDRPEPGADDPAEGPRDRSSDPDEGTPDDGVDDLQRAGLGSTTDEEPATGSSDPDATTAVMSERLFSAGSVVRAGPFLRDGMLYIGCQSGRVHAIDPSTGTRKWCYDGDGIASELAVGEGGVLLGGDQQVTAIDRYAGRERWTQHDRSMTGTATPCRGEDRVFAATRAVRALRTGTGEVGWTHELGSPAWALDADLMNVYVGTNDGEVRAMGVGFGDEAWSYRVGDTVEHIVAHSGTVYARTGDGTLYAFDRSSGYVEWQVSGNGPGGVGPVVDAGDIAVCLGGEFYSLRTADGEVWWRYESDGPFGFSPRSLAVDGTAYVGDHDGTVHALDGWGKAVEWQTMVDDGEVIRGIAVYDGRPVVAIGSDLFRLSPGSITW